MPNKDLQQIHSVLSAGSDVRSALRDLRVLLRNTIFRSSPEVKSLIPLVVSFAQDEEEAAEVLSVLVNFAADNTENRRFLLSDEPSMVQFWRDAISPEIVEINHAESEIGSEEQEFLLILAKQFIYSVTEDEKAGFMAKLVSNGVVDWVFRYHRVHRETLDGRRELAAPMEFLVEYAAIFPQMVTRAQFDDAVEGFMYSTDPRSDYKDEESFLVHAQFLLNATSVEDSAENFPVDRISELFMEVPVDSQNRVDILRKLFATCGNVYSYPSYDNWQNLSDKVSHLTSGWHFLAATAAISLGNCVSSKETQTELIRRISQKVPIHTVARSVFRTHFEDIVYYQAYHFLNNVMTPEMAKSLVVPENAEAFYINTKVMVDNFMYYKEIGHLYVKFLRKLVNMAVLEGGADPMVFEHGWVYLLNTSEAGEVFSLLLQALAKTHDTRNYFQVTLLEKVLALGDSIAITTLLEKIKALAIFLKAYSGPEIVAMYGAEKFERAFLPLVSAFLEQLQASVASAENENEDHAGNAHAAAQNTLANNARFLAVVVQQSLRSTPDEKYGNDERNENDESYENYRGGVDRVCHVAGAILGTKR